jgi:zinc protease
MAADAPAPAQNEPVSIASRLRLSPLTQLRLENGLTVVLEEDHRAPFVAMRLGYRAGWGADPPGKLGLAVLTQRMMTMTTKHVPRGSYDQQLDRVGATDQGWYTGADMTSIWATVPSSAIPTLLWLWSDQMGFFEPDQDPKLFAEARGVTRNQHSEWVDDAAYGAITDIETRALFPEGHPYHATFSPAAVDAMTPEDLRDYHDQHFEPGSAALVLSGDFAPADVVPKIQAYFGPIPRAHRKVASPSRAMFDEGVRLDVAANVKAAAIAVAWRTPAWFDAGDAELDVVARVLVGPRVSTLGWGLVTSRGVATSVTARQASRALGSYFEVRAVVAPGHTPDEVLADIDADLVSTLRVRDDLIAATARTMSAQHLIPLERSENRAPLYAAYTFLRHDPDWLANDVDRYEATTPAAVRAALVRWLRPDHRVVVVVTPDPTASRSGDLRGEAPEKR